MNGRSCLCGRCEHNPPNAHLAWLERDVRCRPAPHHRVAGQVASTEWAGGVSSPPARAMAPARLLPGWLAGTRRRGLIVRVPATSAGGRKQERLQADGMTPVAGTFRVTTGGELFSRGDRRPVLWRKTALFEVVLS